MMDAGEGTLDQKLSLWRYCLGRLTDVANIEFSMFAEVHFK